MVITFGQDSGVFTMAWLVSGKLGMDLMPAVLYSSADLSI